MNFVHYIGIKATFSNPDRWPSTHPSTLLLLRSSVLLCSWRFSILLDSPSGLWPLKLKEGKKKDYYKKIIEKNHKKERLYKYI